MMEEDIYTHTHMRDTLIVRKKAKKANLKYKFD